MEQERIVIKMKIPFLAIKIFGWFEILTIAICINTLLHIDYYSVAFLFLPLPISILGILTVKLIPSAVRLNILLSPLIVFTYTSGIMMILETALRVFNSDINITQLHFIILFMVALIIHIFFFLRPRVKKQFFYKRRRM